MLLHRWIARRAQASVARGGGGAWPSLLPPPRISTSSSSFSPSKKKEDLGRLQYVRHGKEFLLGMASTRRELEKLKARIAGFLQQELHLEAVVASHVHIQAGSVLFLGTRVAGFLETKVSATRRHAQALEKRRRSKARIRKTAEIRTEAWHNRLKDMSRRAWEFAVKKTQRRYPSWQAVEQAMTTSISSNSAFVFEECGRGCNRRSTMESLQRLLAKEEEIFLYHPAIEIPGEILRAHKHLALLLHNFLKEKEEEEEDHAAAETLTMEMAMASSVQTSPASSVQGTLTKEMVMRTSVQTSPASSVQGTLTKEMVMASSVQTSPAISVPGTLTKEMVMRTSVQTSAAISVQEGFPVAEERVRIGDGSGIPLQFLAPIELIREQLSKKGILQPKKALPVVLTSMVKSSDEAIVAYFAAVAHGLLSYYRCCDNFVKVRRLVDFQVRWSALFTLGSKHGCSARKIVATRRSSWPRALNTDGQVVAEFPSPAAIARMGKKFLLDVQPDILAPLKS